MIRLSAGSPAEAFAICAAWSILSVVIQGARFAQAVGHSRGGTINAWLG